MKIPVDGRRHAFQWTDPVTGKVGEIIAGPVTMTITGGKSLVTPEDRARIDALMYGRDLVKEEGHTMEMCIGTTIIVVALPQPWGGIVLGWLIIARIVWAFRAAFCSRRIRRILDEAGRDWRKHET